MKRIKQNYQLNIAMIALMIMSVIMLFVSVVLCIVHVKWSNTGIQSLGYYENGQIRYYSAHDLDYITVESPYQSDLLEGDYVIVYYDPNNTSSCYVVEQAKLALAFGIVSFVMIGVSLTLNILVRKKTGLQNEIIKNGQNVKAEIYEVEIVEDDDFNKFAIIKAKYIDTFNNQEYYFESSEIKDKLLTKNPNLKGTAEICFLKEQPDKYVFVGYHINE